MGDRDLLKPLLERKGSVHFGRVLMKPGKPLTFATLDLQEGEGRKLLVFGLPGTRAGVGCQSVSMCTCVQGCEGEVRGSLNESGVCWMVSGWLTYHPLLLSSAPPH